MVAMNKDQYLAWKQRQAQGDTREFGAVPGEITAGMKPGDRRYNPDTNRWEPQAVDTPIGDYIDVIMNASGITGAPNAQGQGIPSSSGTGSGTGDGQEAPIPATRTGNDTNQEEVGGDGIPWELLATGAGGVALAMLARQLLKRKKPSGPGATGSPAPSGTMMPTVVDGMPNAQAGNVIDGTFNEILGLPPMQQLLEGPAPGTPSMQQDGTVADQTVMKGTQPVDQSVDMTEQVMNDLNTRLAPSLDDVADPELDARVANIIKMLQTGNPGQLSSISKMLDSDDPEAQRLYARLIKMLGVM